MKNKFKKSKIIVPALALITATTVASVTGTVAWFTANRVATVTGSNFALSNNEGDLKITVTNPIGVTATQNGESAVNIAVNNSVLLDASYDGTNIYTDNPGGETTYKTVNAQYATNSNYYYAFQWTMTFSVDVTNVAGTYDIFFNTNSTVTNTASKNTDSAFRMSFKGSQSVVWAPNAAWSSETGSELKYVSSTSATTNYTQATATTHGIVCKSDTALQTLAYDKGTSNTSRGDYLGTATRPKSATDSKYIATLAVTATVWYEGLDATVINDNLNALSNITANLSFYAREAASN